MVTGVMTLWAGPRLASNLEYTEDFMMLWGLSVAEARKHFSNLILVTDSHTAKIMQHFPYDEIFTDLDEPFIPAGAVSVWAAGKFIGFRRAVKEGRPFAHFDGDVLLRSYQRSFEADIFAQSDEFFSVTPKTKSEENLKSIYTQAGCDRLPVLPGFLRFSLTRDYHYPYNMGVCGGSDLEFWSDYVDVALGILNHPFNSKHWLNIHPTMASLFVEQYLFGAMAHNRNKYVTTLFPNSAAANEEFMRGIGYVHLLGDSKQHDMALQAIEDKLKQYHPWMYDIVKALGLKRWQRGPFRGYGYYYSS
jgi:hypothetical protein